VIIHEASQSHHREASRSHRQVVERATEFLRDHVVESVRLSQVSAATGVSERSLRNAFYDVFGMSPKQYILRERLNDVHRALQSAPHARGVITNIATEYGFFELGRFAGTYKAAFGESPSQTLRSGGRGHMEPTAPSALVG
jgi:AraC-like DNA-binding protein